jgi:glycosyltransferase involved in cell wall biosynthesis
LAEKSEFTKLCIDFYGSIHSDVQRSLKESGLEACCRFYDYQPHNEIIAAMKRAALLFFVVPDTSYARGIPTSKLFDYMGAGRPILGIGPVDGDAADILRQTSAGVMVERKEVQEIKEAILRLLLPKKARGAPQTEAYSRKKLTGDLAAVCNKLITGLD